MSHTYEFEPKLSESRTPDSLEILFSELIISYI